MLFRSPEVQLPDATVEKAANINNSNNDQKLPGDGMEEKAAKIEEPVKTFDKHVFNQASSKGDTHSNMQRSSKPKNSIRPSSKNPLW